MGRLWICLLYIYIREWKWLRSILVGAFLSRYRLWNWKLQFIILSFCFEPYSILSHGNVSDWVDSITLVTFARLIAWLNLWNIHTEKTLNSYLHSISDCRSLAIEGFPLTRLRNLRTWHNLKLINCLNWLSDRMIVLCTCTKFACAYSEDLRIQTVPEKFHIVSPIFEHTANVNEQPRVFKSMLPWMQIRQWSDDRRKVDTSFTIV